MAPSANHARWKAGHGHEPRSGSARDADGLSRGAGYVRLQSSRGVAAFEKLPVIAVPLSVQPSPGRSNDATESERSGIVPADKPEIIAQQFQPLDPDLVSKTIPAFFVGRNNDGFWVVRDATGRMGGIFLFKASALWFSKRRSRTTGCATIFLSEPFELDLENRGNPYAMYLAPWVKFATHRRHWVAALIDRIMRMLRR
jgi:hypothetical protein